jgi:hypothetical protein
MMAEDYRFRFTILGRYPARLKGNETAVTVNVLAGRGDLLTYAGTLTMTEAEWEHLIEGIRASLGDRVAVDDHHLHRGASDLNPPRRTERTRSVGRRGSGSGRPT